MLVVQGDVYRMPFRRGYFDRLFCFGMLQHTPDVYHAFSALPSMLKPGGELVVDVYKKSLLGTLLQTKYFARSLTRYVAPDRLYRLTRKWVDLMWPLSNAIRKIPRVGYSINWRLLVADYSFAGLNGEVLKEWAYLDTFDMLSPRYDSPQTATTIRKWFVAAGLTEIEVGTGYNGIEGRGKRPSPPIRNEPGFAQTRFANRETSFRNRRANMSALSRSLLILVTAALFCTVALGRKSQIVKAQGAVLWSADHEEPGENDWYYPGVLILAAAKYTGGVIEWSVDNYSSGLSPQPASIFIDNATIRTP